MGPIHPLTATGGTPDCRFRYGHWTLHYGHGSEPGYNDSASSHRIKCLGRRFALPQARGGKKAFYKAQDYAQSRPLPVRTLVVDIHWSQK